MTEKFSVVDENRLHPPPKRRGDTIFIVAIVLLAIVGIYYLGTLRRSDSTDSGETPITGQTHRSTPTRSDSADSGETPATGQTHRSAPTVPKEPPIESSPHSADELLRQMIAAYSNAKTYSDDAYIESVYEIQLNGRKRSVSYKIPCNITFEKPNFIRMRVNQGVLVCDGATIRGRINHPAFRSEYIETKAPMLFSSVCELYPDMRLAAAMNMEIPSNILWVPPQLVLLLSASPLKTFIPTGGTATLLSPEAIVRTDPKTKEVQREICDRVAIVAPDGTRVLWIDRSDQTLARFELPIEQIEVPKNVQRVERLRIEFPKRVLSDETVQQSFAQDIFKIQLPDEAELVEQFTPISSKIMGEHLSPISLRPLVSGFAPMTMDQLDGKARVFCFWKGIDPALPPDPPGESQDGSGRQGEGNLPSWNGIEYGVGKKSQAFMAELLKTTELLGFEERKFEFILVNVDAGIEASDEMVRSFLEQSMFDMPLYRFTAEEERKNFVEVFDVPSVIVTDVTGVIQKSYRSQLSATGLFRDVKQILLGTDLTKDHEAGNRKLLTKFQQMLTAADQSDTYCTQSESDREEAPLVVPSATPPANVKMTKAWTIASLPGAMNPTVVPLSALTDPKTPIENDAPVLLVPCEGNSLAVINEQGAVVQKKSATGNVAEPISFVRYFAGKIAPILPHLRAEHRKRSSDSVKDCFRKGSSTSDVHATNG